MSGIGFKLVGLRTVQFAVIEEAFKEGQKTEVEQGINISVSVEKRVVIASFKATFKQTNPFIIIECACFFEIQNSNWQEFMVSDKKFVIPRDFAHHLAVFAVGATRGAFHAKVEGTKYSQFIVPVIDLTKRVQNDVVLEITKN